MHGEKEGEKREKTTTLSEEASNVSEQRDKGWVHVIRVHDTTHIFFQVGYPVVTSHFAATPQSDVVRICAHDF